MGFFILLYFTLSCLLLGAILFYFVMYIVLLCYECVQVAAFAAKEGRRPRLMVAKMGQVSD